MFCINANSHVYDVIARAIFPIAMESLQVFFILSLFNQVGQLRTSSHLQLRPGEDKAEQCDTNNNTELHME
jgi:hypothetical protein